MSQRPQISVIMPYYNAGNLTRGTTVYDGGLLKVLKRSVERRTLLYGKANDLPPLSGDGQQ